MTAIQITASLNAQQTSLIIQEVSGIDLSGMTDITISAKKGDQMVLFGTYVLSVSQHNEFKLTHTVEILLSSMFDLLSGRLDDDWWTFEVSASAGEYASNQYGLGVFADVNFAVYSLVNSLHVPEVSKGKSESLFMKVLMLDGLKYLDTSAVNDRGVKFSKRQSALKKLLAI